MKSTKPRKSSKKLSAEITKEFDGEGVRNALLAALSCVYSTSPHITLPQVLVALEVLIAERDGTPHTLVSLVRKLNMPFSTASRVVWSLTKEGGDVAVVKYEQHPTDRRKKLLIMDQANLNRSIPRAITRAMLEYYGESVRKLERAQSRAVSA
jgi:DNA-binding MarR family transcriptional regulator